MRRAIARRQREVNNPVRAITVRRTSDKSSAKNEPRTNKSKVPATRAAYKAQADVEDAEVLPGGRPRP